VLTRLERMYFFFRFGLQQPNSAKADAICTAYIGRDIGRSKGFSRLKISLQSFLNEVAGITPS